MAKKSARGSGGVKTFAVDITPLETQVWSKNQYHTETGEPVLIAAKLPVKELLKRWLFHHDRQLTYEKGGIEAHRCAEKIHDAKGKTVTLNEDEYKGLLEAVKTAPGIVFDDIAVIDRVINAKETTLATG